MVEVIVTLPGGAVTASRFIAPVILAIEDDACVRVEYFAAGGRVEVDTPAVEIPPAPPRCGVFHSAN